jgi:hypothetical protein
MKYFILEWSKFKLFSKDRRSIREAAIALGLAPAMIKEIEANIDDL